MESYYTGNPPSLLFPAKVGPPFFPVDVAWRRFNRYCFMTFSVSVPPAKLMGKILSTLSKSEQVALFDLSYVRLPPNLSEDDSDYDAQVALAITQTNGIAAGVRGVGVFPNVSRMNHGCSSAFNAVYSWREKEQKMAVYVIRPVKQGQEILTAYFDTRRPRDERRLVQKYVLPFRELEKLTPWFYYTGHIYKIITTSTAHVQCARYRMRFLRPRIIV